MQKIKIALKKVPFLFPILRWVYKRIKGTWYRDPEHWIRQISLPQDTSVIQIGSNDGKTGDPIHKLILKESNWRALFVEPVPFLFNRLKQNYKGGKRFQFENSIINDGAEVTFYWVDSSAVKHFPNLPSWYDQLGGFDKGHIVNRLPEVEPFVRSTNLKGMTLEELLQKHKFTKIDLLHIDTEGSDYDILIQLKLSQFIPYVILFERIHLSQEQETQAVRFLGSKYVIYNLGVDMLCIRNDVDCKMETSKKPPSNLIVSD